MISLDHSVSGSDGHLSSTSADLQQVDLIHTHGWCTTEHAQYISSTTGGTIAGLLASTVSSEYEICAFSSSSLCLTYSLSLSLSLSLSFFLLTHFTTGHGLKSIFLTGCGGLVCGLCGQFLYNRLEIWRKRKAIEIHYPELIERKESQWNLVSDCSGLLNGID